MVKLNRPTPVTPLLAPFNRSLSLLTFDDLEHPAHPPCNRLVRLVGNDDHFEGKFLLPSPLLATQGANTVYRSEVSLAGRPLVFHSLRDERFETTNCKFSIRQIQIRFYSYRIEISEENYLTKVGTTNKITSTIHYVRNYNRNNNRR